MDYEIWRSDMPFLIRNGRIVRWLNFKAENNTELWFEQYGSKEPIILTRSSYGKSWEIEAATPDENLMQFIVDVQTRKDVISTDTLFEEDTDEDV